jgi:pimeloyl-ACP methyl ester carboxylesterase
VLGALKPDRTSTIATGGTDLVVREWGDEDGRPLVFWHGLNPFGALQLNEAGPAWAARGLRVVAPVAPGLGDAPPPDDLEWYRPTRIADLVSALSLELGLARFAYVGWSWGASIGVHLAARYPDLLTTLVLLDAGHTDARDTPGWEELTLEERIAEWETSELSFPDWDALLALARERATDWRPALEERIRAGMHERGGVVVARADPRAAAAALHWLGAEPPTSTFSALSDLELPILLVLASRNDTSASVQRFRATLPAAEIRALDSEHDLLAHAADETIALVGDWVAGQPRVA